MTTTNNGPFGPDSFGGDEYRIDDENATMADLGLDGDPPAVAVALQRAERAAVEAREAEARGELVAMAREFLVDNDEKSRPAMRGVRFAARLHESDDDHGGVRMRCDWRVSLVFNDGAALEGDDLDRLSREICDLEDALRRLGALAVPMDGSFFVTREESVVEPS